jgi:hypothetical protein
MTDGRAIAESVDPNTSNDVCTFCRFSEWPEPNDIFGAPRCTLGHTPYFRSISNVGPIWVSDCKAGELLPALAAADTANPRSDP